MFNKEIINKLNLLTKSNNHRCYLALLKDYLEISIAITGSLYFQNTTAYLLAIFFIGSRQRALATLLHDAAHRVLCKNIKQNDFFGKYLSGYLVFQKFRVYVKSHVILHHNYLGDDDKDPDFKHYLLSGLFNPTNKVVFFLKHLFAPFLLSKSPSFILYLIQNRLGRIKEKESVELLLFWAVIFATATIFEVADIIILYWFIPLLTTFPLIGWFIEVAEHYPIIQNNDSLYQSRNRFSSQVELFFTGLHNENYHLTHHLRPDIPYWNIKEAHHIMMSDKRYSEVNEKMGGIFLSSNKNPCLWSQLHANYSNTLGNLELDTINE